MPYTLSWPIMESNFSARRQAQRFLSEHIRNDWDWPNEPPPARTPLDGVSEFRERTYSTTSSEDDMLDRGKEAAAAVANPYKFDSPDSIGTAMQRTREDRKRKRRRKLDDEMAWNDGLRCFVRRRDAWTGADAARRADTPQSSSAATSTSTTTAASTSSAAARSQNDLLPNGAPHQQKTESAPSSSSGSSSQHSASPDEPSAPQVPQPQRPDAAAADAEVLIPVAAPLLPPSNPLRSSITPKAYPEIYNKVVLSSRTPSVPINLADMTRALVQGWKDNGEWPPKVGPLDPLIGRRKSQVKPVRQVVTVGETRHDESFLAHHPKVKRGVESVKKVFRLSGSHGSALNGMPPGEIG